MADSSVTPIVTSTPEVVPGRSDKSLSLEEVKNKFQEDIIAAPVATSAPEVVPDGSGKSKLLEEVKNKFQEEIIASIDIPSFRTSDAADSHFRYNLDNLLSELVDTHNQYKFSKAKNQGHSLDMEDYNRNKNNDHIQNALDRFITFCKRLKDDKVTPLFYKFCLETSPRIAWWTSSSTDWIAQLPSSSVSFVVAGQNKNVAPYLPIGFIFSEAIQLREESESNADHLAPDEAIMHSKIAKHFYLTMLEAIRYQRQGTMDAGDKARERQCERKLKVIYTQLEEAVEEGEDFLDVLLSSIPGLSGPDGQAINVKTVRKALGSAMSTGALFDLMKVLPEVMSKSTDEASARENLLKNPTVKELMGEGATEDKIEDLMRFFKSMGAVTGDGADSSMPLNLATPTGTTAAPSAGVKMRKSIKK
jgi:hypothetical protein